MFAAFCNATIMSILSGLSLRKVLNMLLAYSTLLAVSSGTVVMARSDITSHIHIEIEAVDSYILYEVSLGLFLGSIFCVYFSTVLSSLRKSRKLVWPIQTAVSLVISLLSTILYEHDGVWLFLSILFGFIGGWVCCWIYDWIHYHRARRAHQIRKEEEGMCPTCQQDPCKCLAGGAYV
jgi:hypothetical protein